MKYTMKKVYIILTSLLLSIGVQAQVERNIIFTCAAGNIIYSEPTPQKETVAKTVGKILGTALEATAGSATTTTKHPEYIDALRASIIGGVGNARRVRTVDGQFESIAESGCDMYVEATISSISTTHRTRVWEDKDKKKHTASEYKGNVTGNITFKSVNSDEIIKTLTINTSAYSESWLATEDKALGYCLSSIKNWITDRLNSSYPLHASIVEGAREKKDKEKEVYIDLGSPSGVYKGMTFTVYVVGQVAGRETKKQIGKLRITEVEGDEISLCKVTKGGKDIKSSLDAGKTLLITSND